MKKLRWKGPGYAAVAAGTVGPGEEIEVDETTADVLLMNDGWEEATPKRKRKTDDEE